MRKEQELESYQLADRRIQREMVESEERIIELRGKLAIEKQVRLFERFRYAYRARTCCL
jgi:hypothetical protein